MGTMSVLSRALCFTLDVANEDICFFDRKRLEPKELLSGKSQFQEKNLVLRVKKFPSLVLPRNAIMLCTTIYSPLSAVLSVKTSLTRGGHLQEVPNVI